MTPEQARKLERGAVLRSNDGDLYRVESFAGTESLYVTPLTPSGYTLRVEGEGPRWISSETCLCVADFFEEIDPLTLPRFRNEKHRADSRKACAGVTFTDDPEGVVREMVGLLADLTDQEPTESQAEDGGHFMCVFCGSARDADDSEPINHTADCLITRAKALAERVVLDQSKPAE